MKNFLKLALSAGLVSVALSANATPVLPANGCLALQVLKNDHNAFWRAGATNTLDGGIVVETNVNRERVLKSKADSMINMILHYNGVGDIPPIELVPAANVGSTTTRAWQYSPTEIAPAIRYSKIGPEGKLRATLLGPVSGHNGNANARAWAKTDLYYVALAKGRDVGRGMGGGTSLPNGVEFLVKGAKSQDLVTYHEVEIQLDPNQPIFLYYWRGGSAGVAGYPSGRTIELQWDGT